MHRQSAYFLLHNTSSMNIMKLIYGSRRSELLKHKEENDKAHDELKAATKGQVPGWLLLVLPIVSGVIVGLAVAMFKYKGVTT